MQDAVDLWEVRHDKTDGRESVKPLPKRRAETA